MRRPLLVAAVLALSLCAVLVWISQRDPPGVVVERAEPDDASGEAVSTAPVLSGGSSGGAAKSASPSPVADDASPPSAVVDAHEVAASGPDPVELSTLRFRVVDDLGDPIRAVQLDLRRTYTHRSELLESEEGHYAVELEPGSWSMRLAVPDRCGDGSSTDTSRDPQTNRVTAYFSRTLEIPLDDEPRTITVVRPARLVITVVDAFARPVPDALVRGTGLDVALDEEGRVELPVAPGLYSVRAYSGAPLESVPVELTLAPDEMRAVTLVLPEGGTLAGTVRVGGVPAPGARVQVRPADRRARTDGEGRFDLDGLPPGACTVIAMVGTEQGAQSVSERIEVADGGRTEVVLDLPATDSILVRGRVERCGVACGGFTIVLGSSRSAGAWWTAGAEVALDGGFEVHVPALGRYGVELLGGDGEPPRLPVLVEIPAVPEPFVVLRASCARIAGRVLGPEGPMAFHRVVLSMREDEAWSRGRDDELSTVTDAEGHYLFDALAPGVYAVRAVPHSGTAISPTLELALGEDQAIDGADLVLESRTDVTGRVIDELGWPARHARVLVADGDGRSRSSEPVSADSQGRFRVSLPADAPALLVATSMTGVSRAVRAPASGDEDLVLRLERAATLSVACRDAAGEPLDATISLRDALGFEHAGPFVQESWRRIEIRTDGLVHGVLPPGLVDVRARAGDGRTASARVELTAGERRALELVLR